MRIGRKQYRLLSAVHCAILIKARLSFLCTADLQAGKLQRISGPGIKAVQEIIMCPELQAALGKRDEQEYEYPLGLGFFCCWISGAA